MVDWTGLATFTGALSTLILSAAAAYEKIHRPGDDDDMDEDIKRAEDELEQLRERKQRRDRQQQRRDREDFVIVAVTADA